LLLVVGDADHPEAILVVALVVAEAHQIQIHSVHQDLGLIGFFSMHPHHLLRFVSLQIMLAPYVNQ
jgi:hypothetical protein